MGACVARVLTLEEVSTLPTDRDDNAPVWLESRVVTDRGCLTTLEASILYHIEEGWWRQFEAIHSSWVDRRARNYSVTWRVWDSCPTEAQRDAETWEAEPWDA